MDDSIAIGAVSSNVVWHQHKITRERREALNGHRGSVIWLTGLPGSGKSTVASALEQYLHRSGCRSYVLDGDNVRHGLCGDLGFSEKDREENIRRVAEVSRLFLDAGVIVICAFVSSYRKDRERARALFREGDFVEVYCNCPVEVCERRDPKGHYRLARRGDIKEFTGISSPYEEPDKADLILDTATRSIDDCVDLASAVLRERGILPALEDRLQRSVA